jgi:hypothetical protein
MDGHGSMISLGRPPLNPKLTKKQLGWVLDMRYFAHIEFGARPVTHQA